LHGQNRALGKLVLETESNYFIVLFYKGNAVNENNNNNNNSV